MYSEPQLVLVGAVQGVVLGNPEHPDDESKVSFIDELLKLPE